MQMSYGLNQAIGLEGQLGELDFNWVRSYTNGTTVKKRYTVTVSAAADANYQLTITDASGSLVTVSFNEGAAGTTTTKRDGLIQAVNSSLARVYVHAYPNAAGSFFIEAKQSGTDFTVAEDDANLTLTNDVAFVAHPVVPFGLAVALGSQDTECRPPVATTDKIIGVALHTHAGNYIDSPHAGYGPQSVVSVLRRGVVMVKPETDVNPEDPVYVRVVATGTQRRGAFRNAADSTNTVQLPASRFLTKASAGQLCFMAVDISLQQA